MHYITFFEIIKLILLDTKHFAYEAETLLCDMKIKKTALAIWVTTHLIVITDPRFISGIHHMSETTFEMSQ